MATNLTPQPHIVRQNITLVLITNAHDTLLGPRCFNLLEHCLLSNTAVKGTGYFKIIASLCCAKIRPVFSLEPILQYTDRPKSNLLRCAMSHCVQPFGTLEPSEASLEAAPQQQNIQFIIHRAYTFISLRESASEEAYCDSIDKIVSQLLSRCALLSCSHRAKLLPRLSLGPPRTETHLQRSPFVLKCVKTTLKE